MPHRTTILLLAFGAFAVGTDGYVISGILPSIATGVHVSVAQAGQLVTAFALAYALSAPVLMTLTARAGRRVVLHASLGGFLLANLLGALAGGYWTLLAARILAGAGAAVYMNTAVATATSLAGERHRGRAISLVIGGLSVATALGVPVGTLVGAYGSWRGTLALIVVLTAVGSAGLAFTLPATPPPPAVTMAERLRVAARPAVLVAVATNVCVVAGSFVVYTYLAVLTRAVTPLTAGGVSVVLFVWGAAAAVGTTYGGRRSDSEGPDRVLMLGLLGVVTAFTVLGLVTSLLPVGTAPATAAFLLAVLAWSTLYWTVPGAQVQRVMERAPAAPAVAVSVSSASSYLGVALGGAIGGLTVGLASPAALPWVALLPLGCAVLLMTTWDRRLALPGAAHAGPAPREERSADDRRVRR